MNEDSFETNDDSWSIEDIPVIDRRTILDQKTIDFALTAITNVWGEVLAEHNARIFGLQQQLLVEDLTPTERIEVRVKIAELTQNLEIATGVLNTSVTRIDV